ncbi:NAD(P)/FAD-dependent oxidoreductase [Hamadaea sp. NPDC050747]|uniref:phytoene desaturase family protein n=1 Tax=Hamadaea sp. NPDC050747 TaxID=3155789 RepID=UPI0033CDFBCA
MFRTDVQNTDVAIVGGGLAGMATALRLQASGLSTVLFEAHGHLGGCAGYWRHRGFSFDVGATTLVDFEPGGVGAELLDSVGVPAIEGEHLPGYEVWLPDRTVTLHRDPAQWHAERLAKFGDDADHQAFWAELDRLADVFWRASRAGVKLPMRRPADVLHNLRAVGLRNVGEARRLRETLAQAMRRHRVDQDQALTTLLGMLVEDTVHSTVERAPLINAALGITIRGAGLTRHHGGMHGFWRTLVARYRQLGGRDRTGTRVHRVRQGFQIETSRGVTRADQVVLAVPAPTAQALCGGLPVARRLTRYLERDRGELGGAVIVFLGVPEAEVGGHRLTHHQFCDDYARPFGDGTNMFVSVSAPGDTLSAPPGHRAVMISTHTSLSAWSSLDTEGYAQRKKEIGERLITLARRAYPALGQRAVVAEVGTPRAFERYAFRPGGAVGGPHQSLRNSNQYAIPHDLGGRGLWLAGDSTWPGLGTVACVLGSRIVADGILRERRR